MKELKNIYGYELDKLKTLLINKEGIIVGGFEDVTKARKGEELILSPVDKIKVLDTKNIIIVEDTAAK